MFSIWTNGIEDSLKRTPGGAARLTSLHAVVSAHSDSSHIIFKVYSVLAKCSAILQSFQ